MEKKIIIFRFDKNPDVCLNRLQILKFYNPAVPVYGIYGGNENELHRFINVLGDYLCDIYTVKNRTGEWKWKNFDLVLREWYNDAGSAIDFDMAYTNEWDLLMFGSLDEIYTGINCGDIGLTGVIPLEKLEDNWYWMSGLAKEECFRLIYFVIKQYHYKLTPLAVLCPGFCFPKSFLADYCKLNFPELCHDEIRIPLFAQILNYPIKDTGFFKNWFTQDEPMYFNCNRQLINLQTICNELNLNGRKVFHPFRDIYPLNRLYPCETQIHNI
jgi:hypothetical protein